MTALTGKVAIISGGLGDIGRAIALELGSRGAKIAVGDVLEPSGAAGFLGTLRANGIEARYDQVDVTDAQAVRQWVVTVEEQFGTCDIIVPNAAIVLLKDVRAISTDEWQHELNVNLSGAFHLAQAGSLRLLEAGIPGHIVFIGSWAGHAPHTHIPTYCVAKAGLRMLGRCMAAELGPYGIQVNEVAPGYVDAGLSGKILRDFPEQREPMTRKVPLRRLIDPSEVAWQVANLCDPRNRNATGSVVLMDGGLSLIS
jgi:NAD(P)-dependent dehydrogenase (short-subunit alcohol dehydrogenase family)